MNGIITLYDLKGNLILSMRYASPNHRRLIMHHLENYQIPGYIHILPDEKIEMYYL